MKRKVHYITLRLVFDKKCTRAEAVPPGIRVTWEKENAA